jgi:hypothetical protein
MKDAMSAIGPKRTSQVALHMSAVGGEADIQRDSRGYLFNLATAQFFNFDINLPERRCQRFSSNARQFTGDL